MKDLIRKTHLLIWGGSVLTLCFLRLRLIGNDVSDEESEEEIEAVKTVC